MLSQWYKDNYNVSFGVMTIVSQLLAEELPGEINNVIIAMEKSRKIN